MTIETKPIADADLDRARQIYLDSFPPEERRPWDDIVAKHTAAAASPIPGFSLLGIYADGIYAGFITIWRFDGFDYVEHFAIDPEKRGGGLGAKAIASVLSGFSSGRPVVLEAEHAHQSAMATRRLGFYERCGFTVHHAFQYIQPPYAPGLPEVPLLLLSANATTTLPLDCVAATLHRRVYNTVDPMDDN